MRRKMRRITYTNTVVTAMVNKVARMRVPMPSTPTGYTISIKKPRPSQKWLRGR